jgi:Phage integrase, N-terminal SAM-like domain
VRPSRQHCSNFLADYRGYTGDADTLDLRQFTAWCWQRQHRLFEVRGVDIECFARELEDRGKARATVARRLFTIVGFYRYAAEEGVIEHSSAVHIRRPRIDYESHGADLDRNELVSILVSAGLSLECTERRGVAFRRRHTTASDAVANGAHDRLSRPAITTRRSVRPKEALVAGHLRGRTERSGYRSCETSPRRTA